MDAFTTHTGVGVPLRRSNVDTDQIIPAVYLKRVTRTGFEDGLFAAWRGDETFVLNDPPTPPGSVLVAGPDFGTGSSREHAVWANKLTGGAGGDVMSGGDGADRFIFTQATEFFASATNSTGSWISTVPTSSTSRG